MLPTWPSTPSAGSKTRVPAKIRGPAIVMTAAQTTSATASTSPTEPRRARPVTHRARDRDQQPRHAQHREHDDRQVEQRESVVVDDEPGGLRERDGCADDELGRAAVHEPDAHDRDDGDDAEEGHRPARFFSGERSPSRSRRPTRRAGMPAQIS